MTSAAEQAAEAQEVDLPSEHSAVPLRLFTWRFMRTSSP